MHANAIRLLLKGESMAGDWLKIRHDLDDDPHVLHLLQLLAGAVVDSDHLVGKLRQLWKYADRHTVDGFIPFATAKTADVITGVNGFGKAMIEVGWLEVTDKGAQIPRFDEHNSQSAKDRCLSQKRMSKQRMLRPRYGETVTEREPEKRREEKNDYVVATDGDVVGELENLVRELVNRGVGTRRAQAAAASSEASLIACILRYFDSEVKRGALKNPQAALRSMLSDPEGKWEFERDGNGAWKPPGSAQASQPPAESIAEVTARRRAQAAADSASAVRGLKGVKS